MSYDKKNSFLIFAPEYAQVTRSFTLVQKGEFFDAILDYVTFQFTPTFDEPMQKAFEYIKKRIDENMESYQRKCIKNKEIAIERERRKHERDTKRKRTRQKRPPNDTDNDTDILNTLNSEFQKPTLEEISVYCSERKNKIDPKKFFDYFEASNWIDSKGDPVLNWKQKIITWEGGRNKNKRTDVPAQKKQSILDHNYKQLQEKYGKEAYPDVE
jgi:hypothetical protein